MSQPHTHTHTHILSQIRFTKNGKTNHLLLLFYLDHQPRCVHVCNAKSWENKLNQWNLWIWHVFPKSKCILTLLFSPRNPLWLTQFAWIRKRHWVIFHFALFYCRNGQFPAVLKHHQFNNFKRCFHLLKCVWKQSPGVKISRKFSMINFLDFRGISSQSNTWNWCALVNTMNLHAAIERVQESYSLD